MSQRQPMPPGAAEAGAAAPAAAVSAPAEAAAAAAAPAPPEAVPSGDGDVGCMACCQRGTHPWFHAIEQASIDRAPSHAAAFRRGAARRMQRVPGPPVGLPMHTCVIQLSAWVGRTQGDQARVEAMLREDIMLLKLVTALKGGRMSAWHIAARKGHVHILKTLARAILHCSKEDSEALDTSLRCGHCRQLHGGSRARAAGWQCTQRGSASASAAAALHARCGPAPAHVPTHVPPTRARPRTRGKHAHVTCHM